MIKCVWKCASATCAKQEHAKDWQKCFEGVRITYTMCSSESECARVQHVQNGTMLKAGKSASEVQKYHIRIPIRTRDVRVLPESPKYPECPMFILKAPPKSCSGPLPGAYTWSLMSWQDVYQRLRLPGLPTGSGRQSHTLRSQTMCAECAASVRMCRVHELDCGQVAC